jgi:hypothetical protein
LVYARPLIAVEPPSIQPPRMVAMALLAGCCGVIDDCLLTSLEEIWEALQMKSAVQLQEKAEREKKRREV